MYSRLAFVLAVAGLTALVSATAALAQLTCEVRCTGPERPGCPLTNYPTIQSAIDDTRCANIVLRATADSLPYREQLYISRSLSIAGKTVKIKDENEHIVTTLQPPADMIGPNLITISSPPPPPGSRQLITRVKFKHLIIQGPGVAPEGLVALRGGRDTGITVNHCVFRDIKPPAYDARWAYVAIWLGGPRTPGSRASNHTIIDSKFYGYQNVGILVEGEGTSAFIGQSTGGTNIISGSSDTDPDKVRRCGEPLSTCADRIAHPVGIMALNGASPVVKGRLATSLTVLRNTLLFNETEDGRGAAVFVYNGPSDNVFISNNGIDHNALGISVEKTDGVTIFNNPLFDNGYGVLLGWVDASNANVIQGNRIEGGGTGLTLGLSSENAISKNIFQSNSAYGANLLSTAVNNTLYGNRAQENGSFGFRDDSPHGTGKAVTANTYSSNTCAGNNRGDQFDQSSPAGLCR